MTEWIKQFEMLQDKYKWLVLLNTTKLMKLYNLLKSDEHLHTLCNKVKKELGILFVNDIDNERTLTESIKVYIE